VTVALLPPRVTVRPSSYFDSSWTSLALGDDDSHPVEELEWLEWQTQENEVKQFERRFRYKFGTAEGEKTASRSSAALEK